MGTRGVWAVHPLWKGFLCSVPASLPTHWELSGCVFPLSCFFFSLPMHFLVHPWKHITTLLWKKTFLSLSLSLSELEGRDATGVGGNFPTEAFLSSRKCLFKLRRVLCQCKNCARYTLGAFIVSFPKNPTLQVLHFLATANSHFYFFFFAEGKFGWKPPNFPRKTPELKLLKRM